MDETSSLQSRRQLLRYCAVGSITAFAGCLGGDDGQPSDDDTPTGNETPTDRHTQTAHGTPTDRHTQTETDTPADGDRSEQFELAGDGSAPFRNWLVSDNPIVFEDGTRLLCQYNDYDAAATQNWEAMQAQRQNLAETLGTSDQSLRSEVLIGGNGASQHGRVLFGTFDSDEVIAVLEDEGMTVTDDYRGYTVLDDQIAVGDEAVLATSLYREYLETHAGDGNRLGESDDAAGIVLDLLPAGIQISVARDPERETVEVSGTSVTEVDADGAFERKVRVFVFGSESDASVDAALEYVTMADEEPLTAEANGRIVMIEYVPE